MSEILSRKSLASAETLLSAAAIDRIHNGARTNYNRELSAQGVANLLCGALGGLPMTGVIVRSSANVQAGAAIRASAVMHSLWILAAVAFFAATLRMIPMAALAGVLVVTGYRLVRLGHLRLMGVLVGIGLSLLELLPWLKRLRLVARARTAGEGAREVNLAGSATMLQFSYLANTLDAAPAARRVTIRLRKFWHIDHTCAEHLSSWIARRQAAGEQVRIETGSVVRHREMALALQGA